MDSYRICFLSLSELRRIAFGQIRDIFAFLQSDWTVQGNTRVWSVEEGANILALGCSRAKNALSLKLRFTASMYRAPATVPLPQNSGNVRFRMSKSFKTLGVVVGLVFALSFTAHNAHADTFTPVFNTTGCLAGPCDLPTAPEVTFPSPTTMTVTLFGLSELVIIPAVSSRAILIPG